MLVRSMLRNRWRQRLALAGVALACVACDREPQAPPEALTPAAVEAALVAAESYFGRQQLNEAEAILAKLIEKAPREHRAHELYGQVLYIKGIELKQRGEEEEARMLLDRAYGHYRAAVGSADEREPTAAAGLEQSAGEIAFAAGRRAEALGHFERAGRLDPTNPKHALYEAQVLLLDRRLPEARRALERVLVLDPDEAFAHASLATVALEEDDQAGAIAHIEEARRIDPHALALRVQEAKIRRRCNQPRRALELLVTLVDEPRAQEGVAHEIAECYLLLGEPLKAAEAWQHRYRRRPNDWRSAVRAGEALLKAGEREQAWWCYQQGQRAAPEAAEVKSLERALAGE